MAKKVASTGNEAVANAMRIANPDVCGAYPITPATEIMQRFTSFVSNGKAKTEMVLAESEHSAMSACIGAAAAGGRNPSRTMRSPRRRAQFFKDGRRVSSVFAASRQ